MKIEDTSMRVRQAEATYAISIGKSAKVTYACIITLQSCRRACVYRPIRMRVSCTTMSLIVIANVQDRPLLNRYISVSDSAM